MPVFATGLLVAGGLAALLVIRRTADRDREPAVTASLASDEPILDTATAAATPAAAVLPVTPDSAPSAEAVQRSARTWTKVHARRSVNGELVAVLLPGDTVQADSLIGSWWRIALEGRVLGYVHASTLRD